jgi:hypothetical protein
LAITSKVQRGYTSGAVQQFRLKSLAVGDMQALFSSKVASSFAA